MSGIRAVLVGLHFVPVGPLGIPDGLPEIITGCFVGIRVPCVEGGGLCFEFIADLSADPGFLVGVGADDGFWNIVDALT